MEDLTLPVDSWIKLERVSPLILRQVSSTNKPPPPALETAQVTSTRYSSQVKTRSSHLEKSFRVLPKSFPSKKSCPALISASTCDANAKL